MSLVSGWRIGVPSALAILGAEYVGSLYLRGESHYLSAAIIGSALLLTAELGYWSLDARTPSDEEPGLVSRRILLLTLVVACSLSVGLVGVGVAQISVKGSLALTAVATGAAVLALGLVAWLAMTRRSSPRKSRATG